MAVLEFGWSTNPGIEGTHKTYVAWSEQLERYSTTVAFDQDVRLVVVHNLCILSIPVPRLQLSLCKIGSSAITNQLVTAELESERLSTVLDRHESKTWRVD